MDCRIAGQRILESLDSPSLQGGLVIHLAACPAYTAFAAKQRALDLRLSAALPPPALTSTFSADLRRRIRHETTTVWPDWIPGAVQLVSCGAVTILFAILLPFDSSLVLGAETAATLFGYVLLTAVQSSFEEADDPTR